MLKQLFLVGVGLLLAVTVVAENGGNIPGQNLILKGSGATFPFPLYRRWFAEYEKETGVRVPYKAVGSGAGIKALLDRAVDFGATDVALSDAELSSRKQAILHVPTCVGAVAITCNLPAGQKVRFSAKTLSGIFSGRITHWRHSEILRENPKLHDLPNSEITVVHRSDGSGTTFVFTDYLSKSDRDWLNGIGRGKKVSWPVGIGVAGNALVAKMIARIPGSIGYLQLNYAREHRLTTAAVKNTSGDYISPSLVSVSAAAQVDIPDDARISITDTTNQKGYPISAFTYLIFYEDQDYNGRTVARAKALSNLLTWCIGAGQKYNQSLHYAPLPKNVRLRAAEIVEKMYHGKPQIVSDMTERKEK